MGHYRKLVGERCYLSPVAAEDGELWAEGLNDLEVTIPPGDEAYGMIPGEAIRNWAADAAKGQEPIFTIVEKTTERAIRRCLLFGVNQTDRTAECGLFIG